METEIFGLATQNGNGNILGENRELGFKALPADCPEWVRQRVKEFRTAKLEGREPRTFVPVRSNDKWTTDAIARLAGV